MGDEQARAAQLFTEKCRCCEKLNGIVKCADGSYAVFGSKAVGRLCVAELINASRITADDKSWLLRALEATRMDEEGGDPPRYYTAQGTAFTTGEEEALQEAEQALDGATAELLRAQNRLN